LGWVNGFKTNVGARVSGYECVLEKAMELISSSSLDGYDFEEALEFLNNTFCYCHVNNGCEKIVVIPENSDKVIKFTDYRECLCDGAEVVRSLELLKLRGYGDLFLSSEILTNSSNWELPIQEKVEEDRLGKSIRYNWEERSDGGEKELLEYLSRVFYGDEWWEQFFATLSELNIDDIHEGNLVIWGEKKTFRVFDFMSQG
jgi:hypothetical protein